VSFQKNLERVQERVLKACLRSGRSPEEIRILAVSKYQSLSAVQEACAAGQRLFSENRVQEAAEKFGVLTATYPDIELHMTGSLQRNKAKQAIKLFSCVQSVDRIELIRELAKHSPVDSAKPLEILLELHTGEESKAGFRDLDELRCACDELAKIPSGLSCRGLMTMAPFTTDEAAIRKSFRMLRETRDILLVEYPHLDWSILSMGMSNDFELAVEEGATLLRLGTVLFKEDQ
jgi:PLP dependent protein